MALITGGNTTSPGVVPVRSEMVAVAVSLEAAGEVDVATTVKILINDVDTGDTFTVPVKAAAVAQGHLLIPVPGHVLEAGGVVHFETNGETTTNCDAAWSPIFKPLDHTYAYDSHFFVHGPSGWDYGAASVKGPGRCAPWPGTLVGIAFATDVSPDADTAMTIFRNGATTGRTFVVPSTLAADSGAVYIPNSFDGLEFAAGEYCELESNGDASSGLLGRYMLIFRRLTSRPAMDYAIGSRMVGIQNAKDGDQQAAMADGVVRGVYVTHGVEPNATAEWDILVDEAVAHSFQITAADSINETLYFPVDGVVPIAQGSSVGLRTDGGQGDPGAIYHTVLLGQ